MVAQLVEHLILNQNVAGSIPARDIPVRLMAGHFSLEEIIEVRILDWEFSEN